MAKEILREKLFKAYWRLYQKYHKKIVSRLCMPLFDGIHPSNIFNYRADFFKENVSSHDTVIDAACGTGNILYALAPIIREGYGIDKSSYNIRICRTKHFADNLTYEKNDIFSVDYPKLKTKTAYTTAVFSHILEHIEKPAELLNRVDAKKVLICVPSEENWQTDLSKHFSLPYLGDSTHLRLYTRKKLEKQIAAAGYHINFMGFNNMGEIVCAAEKGSDA